ncbi:MAG TPA: diacylglycerol kinase [Lachnospiraceae bacterium]|nr:diacylglycerol kinase [Lachnospiraceae bacterium]
MNTTTMLIYNPVSGRTADKLVLLGKAVKKLSSGGRALLVCQTSGKKDVERFKKAFSEEPGCDEIIVFGGDGTLHNVLNALIRSGKDIPLGYIPMGSTNDYAKNLGINRENALKVITARDCRAMDVGCFNGEYFSYVAAFGNFTDISYSTNQQTKNNLGYLAYLIEAVGKLLELKPFHARIHVGEKLIEDDFAVGLFTNAFYTAGLRNRSGIIIDLRDGLLEYVLVKMPENPRDLSGIISGLLNENRDNEYIYSGSAKSFLIESAPMAWTLDGENGGIHERCEISVLPQRIKMYVSAQS